MSVLAALLGVSAGLVGVVDTVPYLRDVMRGSTRPHRGTWLIWSALAVVVCLSQWAAVNMSQPSVDAPQDP